MSSVSNDKKLLAEYEALSIKEKINLGSKADTLTFIGYVVSHRVKGEIVTSKGNKNKECPVPFGVCFNTTEDIVVPYIPLEYTLTTGVPEKEVNSRAVKANSWFILTIVETLYFLSSEEYSCKFKVKGQKGITGVMRINRILTNKGVAKLPTPLLEGEKREDGSKTLRFQVVYADIQNKPNGGYTYLSDVEFKRIIPLIEAVINKKDKRTERKKDKPEVDTAILTALYLRKQLRGEA